MYDNIVKIIKNESEICILLFAIVVVCKFVFHIIIRQTLLPSKTS